MATPRDSYINDPAAAYAQRCATFGAQRDRYARRSSLNANLSLVLVAVAVVCFGAALWLGQGGLLMLAGLFALGFVASFIHHGRVDATLRRYTELLAINEEGQLRLQRDWDALPLRQPPSAAAPQPRRALQVFAPFSVVTAPRAPAPAPAAAPADGLAHDLDLLGRESLQHLLNTPAMPVGLATLRDWLLVPAPAAEARARHAAVAELAPLHDFRDELALQGRLLGAAQTGYEQFLRWAEGQPWLPGHGWLLWAARLLPLATLTLAVLQWLGVLAAPLWLLGVAAGVVLTATMGRSVDRVLDEVSERQVVFAAYAALFAHITSQPFTAPALCGLQANLTAGGQSADAQMRRLARIMALADLRGWMFFYPVQVATLWNVHVLWLLERWQAVAGSYARDWLAALGQAEALAALATLAHDNPGWAFPELLDARPADPVEPLLAAQALGHPLLPPAQRVDNDVTLGPAGRLLLVTGSNMSGKSTLLRAIGLNVVLAQCGGPVCAGELRLSPVELATSMRVQDSLNQGVSYFMAELQRLKQVIVAAEQAQGGARTLLFLLDEILHGTNSSERQIAARLILLRLLALGATGAVSTHDLALADTPELAVASDLVHFSEQFARGPDGPSMHFDYRLRPGIATSTNALKLMEMIGLTQGLSAVSEQEDER